MHQTRKSIVLPNAEALVVACHGPKHLANIALAASDCSGMHFPDIVCCAVLLGSSKVLLQAQEAERIWADGQPQAFTWGKKSRQNFEHEEQLSLLNGLKNGALLSHVNGMRRLAGRQVIF